MSGFLMRLAGIGLIAASVPPLVENCDRHQWLAAGFAVAATCVGFDMWRGPVLGPRKNTTKGGS
jgi:hypothetical protein